MVHYVAAVEAVNLRIEDCLTATAIWHIRQGNRERKCADTTGTVRRISTQFPITSADLNASATHQTYVATHQNKSAVDTDKCGDDTANKTSPPTQYLVSSIGPEEHGLFKVSQPKLRYDTRCYFNVRSKANMSQLNLPHGTNN